MSYFICKTCKSIVNKDVSNNLSKCIYCGSTLGCLSQSVQSVNVTYKDVEKEVEEKADFLLGNRDFNKAASIYSRLVNTHPDNSYAWKGLLLSISDNLTDMSVDADKFEKYFFKYKYSRKPDEKTVELINDYLKRLKVEKLNKGFGNFHRRQENEYLNTQRKRDLYAEWDRLVKEKNKKQHKLMNYINEHPFIFSNWAILLFLFVVILCPILYYVLFSFISFIVYLLTKYTFDNCLLYALVGTGITLLPIICRWIKCANIKREVNKLTIESSEAYKRYQEEK